MKKILLVSFFGFISITFLAPNASAESWWGDGARSNAWVLAHGGTVIHYKIIASGAKDRYKAILYKDGKVVEWENGKTGLFDDPKDGIYVVKAFRGGIEKDKTSKGGKKILSSNPIVAHPGETIQVTLDDINDSVVVTSNRRAAPPVKRTPEKVETPAPVSIPPTEDSNEITVPSEQQEQDFEVPLTFGKNILSLGLGKIE